MNTKFHMFSIYGYPAINAEYSFGKILRTVQRSQHIHKYDFPIVLPVDMEVIETTEDIVKKTWFGKEEIVKRPYYSYYLVFGKELTEDELKLWKMFKMGWWSQERDT